MSKLISENEMLSDQYKLLSLVDFYEVLCRIAYYLNLQKRNKHSNALEVVCKAEHTVEETGFKMMSPMKGMLRNIKRFLL